MRTILLGFLFIPFLVFAQSNPADQDWKVSLTASGSLTTGETFESVGVATFTGLENLLASRGGFESAYRDFKSNNQLTYGVWQEAEAFSQFLKSCNIEVTPDLLAMKIGLKRIFNSQNDQEVNEVLSDLGPRLTFEKKIELVSRMGGMLLQGYDTQRAGGDSNGGGVVSLRDMINARRDGNKAGVCRDMSQALAQSLKQMGVDQAYVVAYQTAGGGHATVLAQDPNNPSKTFNINYNYVTTTESASALSHLQQDSTIPSVGVDMRIFDADGKPLTTLPTHLGVLLHEIAGGSARDLDPLLRSENQVAGARYHSGNNLTIGAGAGLTPDGDKVVAVSSSYRNESENFPLRMSVVVYNNERPTNLRGNLSSTGVFIEGEQHFISDPFKVQTSGGVVSMNFEGRLGFNTNISYNALSGSSNTQRSISNGRDLNASAGVRTRYASESSGTRAEVAIMANGGIAKSDVRDEGSTTFDLRSISGTAQVSQRLASNLDGFAGGTLVSRPGLGIQASQEFGVIRRNSDDSRTALVFERQGSVGSQAPSFIPGSHNEYSVDVSHLDERYAVSGNVFCRMMDDNRQDCGVRTTATLKFGAR